MGSYGRMPLKKGKGDGRRFKINHVIGITPITPFVAEISGVKIESTPVNARWNPIDLETLALGVAQTVLTFFHLRYSRRRPEF